MAVEPSEIPSREIALDAGRQARVLEEVRRLVRSAERRYDARLEEPIVTFDLGGLAAGQYRSSGRERRVRFNPWIFARYFEENLRDTVAHEVAHYVVDVLHGRRGVKPHGRQWRAVMSDFGVSPNVRHHFDLDGMPVRRQRRFTYACGCGEHELSAVRHNRVVSRRAAYHCRRCGVVLQMRND